MVTVGGHVAVGVVHPAGAGRRREVGLFRLVRVLAHEYLDVIEHRVRPVRAQVDLDLWMKDTCRSIMTLTKNRTSGC